MKKLVLLGSTNSPVVKELNNLMPVTEGLQDLHGDEALAYIIDASSAPSGDLALPGTGEPVILLDNVGRESVEGCVASIPATAAVIHRMDGYTITQVFDTPLRKTLEKQTVEVSVKGDIVTKRHAPPVTEEAVSAPPLSAVEVAAGIAESLTGDRRSELYAAVAAMRGDVPIDLPKGQYAFDYVSIERDVSLLDNRQKAHNASLIELALIASHNPDCKYLRVDAHGAGFHPGALLADNTYSRQAFHQTISMNLSMLDERVGVYETSPKNVSGTTSYTEGSSFSVGVDISKNPGFKPSYTISDSHTVTVQDFMIINKSSGRTSQWDFQLGMVNEDEFAIFEEPFMRKARVKSLPTLAKENLQPYCQAVYRVGGDYNAVVPLQLSWTAKYGKAWVEGNWASYTMFRHWEWANYGYWTGNPWRINFNRVHA